MSVSPQFSAATWIAQKTQGGTHLSLEAQQAVGSFAIMWSFFESTVCGNRASIATFERVIEQYDASQVPPATAKALESSLAFWRFRYRSTSGVAPRFDGLNFRSGDRRELVEKVISGNASDRRAEVFALMIIVYRLRNNLFHGIKTLVMLNDQVENLTNASRCLAALMEAIPSPLVLMRPSRLRSSAAQE